MNKWLHRHHFSYKKPTGVPHKYSEERQRIFTEAYEKMKQETGDDEPVLFIDGVHSTQGTKLAYGWIYLQHICSIIDLLQTLHVL